MSRNVRSSALQPIVPLDRIRDPVSDFFVPAVSLPSDLTERNVELLNDMVRLETRRDIVVGRQETNRAVSGQVSAIACTWLQNRQSHEQNFLAETTVTTGRYAFCFNDRETTRIRLRVSIW